MAQFLAQNGKGDQAVPLIEQTVRDNPTNLAAREVMVRLYIEQRDFAAARVAADDLKTLAPDKAVGYYLAGIVASSEKRNADAQASLQRALDIQPDAADALAALVRLHVAANHTDEARRVIEKTLARNPDNVAARNLLGELQLAAKNTAAARTEFTRVIATAPKWTLGYRNLALTELSAGNDAAA